MNTMTIYIYIYCIMLTTADLSHVIFKVDSPRVKAQDKFFQHLLGCTKVMWPVVSYSFILWPLLFAYSRNRHSWILLFYSVLIYTRLKCNKSLGILLQCRWSWCYTQPSVASLLSNSTIHLYVWSYKIFPFEGRDFCFYSSVAQLADPLLTTRGNF